MSIAIYAKGISTWVIQYMQEELYGMDVSAFTIS